MSTDFSESIRDEDDEVELGDDITQRLTKRSRKLTSKWWKVNNAKFPTWARMARDILGVPATTVASEAAFSVGGRVIDENRASLLPEIVEALVTTNDWIESNKKKNVEEHLLEQ